MSEKLQIEPTFTVDFTPSLWNKVSPHKYQPKPFFHFSSNIDTIGAITPQSVVVMSSNLNTVCTYDLCYLK